MNGGRDYIVEYQTGQFQRGSLVLRFDDDPSEAQLRLALARAGVPVHRIEEVAARPLETGRRWQPVRLPATPAPTPPPTSSPAPVAARARRGGRNGWGLLFILVLLFAGQTVRSEEAIDHGRRVAGGDCGAELDIARGGADPDEGIIGGLFSTAPTGFLLTPANAAFMVACLGGSVN